MLSEKVTELRLSFMQNKNKKPSSYKLVRHLINGHY